MLSKRTTLHLFGHILALFAVFFWGITHATTKALMGAEPGADALTPVQVLCVRFVIGYVALWILAPRPMPWQGGAGEGRLALAGFVGIVLCFLAENYALAPAVGGSANMAAVLVNLSPLFTSLFALALGRTAGLRSWPLYWLGVAMAFVGVAAAVTGGGFDSLKGSLAGALLAILAAIFWAVYTMLPQHVPHPAGKLLITRRIFLWALLLMSPLCALDFGDWKWTPFREPSKVVGILFLGLVASALCYAAWNLAVRIVGSLRASLWLYLSPVVGVFTAAVMLDEPLTSWIGCGLALTLVGIALSAYASRTRKKPNVDVE